MALYEYKCPDKECNHVQTELVKNFEDKYEVVVLCEKCGKEMKPIEISLSDFKFAKRG